MHLAHLNLTLNCEIGNLKYDYNPVKQITLTVKEEDIGAQRVK